MSEMFPYRWTRKTIFKNLDHFFYTIRRGIKNVVRWTPVIWNDEDFDWCNLAWVMEWKMRQMSKHFSQHGVCVNREKVAKELLICAELLRRLREDELSWEPITPLNVKRDNQRKREWEEIVGQMIGKHLREWWD
jgi:hypothetical protein